jgi:serine/threonine protein phosphatase PrpC
MKVRYAAKTDVGMRRVHNEDCFAVLEDEQVFLVADGMGGHASGEVAARLATETVVEFYQRTRTDEDATWPFKLDRALSFEENRLDCAVRLANRRIFEVARADVTKKGMGTTIVAATVLADRVCIAHVGDLRAYRIRDGAIAQLTRDHSLLEDYKDANPGMSTEEQETFPHKNVITRALGLHDSVEVAVQTHELRIGDVFVLCTDGLSGMMVDADIARIANEPKTLPRVVAELVDRANRNGGTDNVTTIVVHCVE